MWCMPLAVRRIQNKPLRSILTILQLALGIWLVTVIFSINFYAGSQLIKPPSVRDPAYAQIGVVKVRREPNRTYYTALKTFGLADCLDLQEMSEHIDLAFLYRQGFLLHLYYDERRYLI